MLKRMTLAALALVAGAAAGGAQVLPTGPPELDHFYCYFIEAPVQYIAVQLQDQFDVARKETEFIKDLRAVRLCNPVQKTLRGGAKTPIRHPLDHLLFYLLNPQPIIPREVVVENQFGYQVLYTRNAEVLAVPSGKALPGANGLPPEPPPIPQDLDHFKCYSASGQIQTRVVLLKDQFQSVVVEVLEPILFCNPVEKTIPSTATVAGTVTPIRDPKAHLTCYTVTPRPFQGVAFINNQFVPKGVAPPELTVLNSDILCLPSYKLRWTEITYPSDKVPGAAGLP